MLGIFSQFYSTIIPNGAAVQCCDFLLTRPRERERDREKMDALRASYGDTCSDPDSDSDPSSPLQISNSNQAPANPLPPPPIGLLSPLNSLGTFDYYFQSGQTSRVRSFPHVEGNYALHVYIPVHIPSASRREMVQFLKKVTSMVAGLHLVDVDVPLNNLLKDDKKLEQDALGREFHISLGRTVPIRVHQIDSMVAMLRQKLQLQRRYWIDFSKWEVFVNDEQTRCFLSLEVIAGGLAEIARQIQAVNEVYKLHNLPEFYKDPRPHISIAWALGDTRDLLKRVVEEGMKRCTPVRGLLQKHIFTSKFGGIECKIGKKIYSICKIPEE